MNSARVDQYRTRIICKARDGNQYSKIHQASVCKLKIFYKTLELTMPYVVQTQPLFIITVARDTAAPPITGWISVDVVEGQLDVRIDVIVALVKEYGHAATGHATVVDDSLGQRLDLVAWKAASFLKKGADTMTCLSVAPIDAHDPLVVLIPATVGDMGGDLLVQALGRLQAWVGGVEEATTGGRAPAVYTECSDT